MLSQQRLLTSAWSKQEQHGAFGVSMNDWNCHRPPIQPGIFDPAKLNAPIATNGCLLSNIINRIPSPAHMSRTIAVELNIVPNDTAYVSPTELRNGVVLHKSFHTATLAQELMPDLILSHYGGLISNACFCVIADDAIILYLTLEVYMCCCNISIHGVVTVPLLNREDIIANIWQSFDMARFKGYADMDRVFCQSLKQELCAWPTNRAQALLAQVIQHIRNHQLAYETLIIGEVDAASYQIKRLTSAMDKCALDHVVGETVGNDEGVSSWVDGNIDYKRLFLLALKAVVGKSADEELALLGSRLLEKVAGLSKGDHELRLFLKGCAGR